MKTSEATPMANHVSPTTATLLKELREECLNVSKLLAQLELPGLHQNQVDDLLGDLSAAILHLHEHTRGLDEQLLHEEK
jgi:hypothetical protein